MVVGGSSRRGLVPCQWGGSRTVVGCRVTSKLRMDVASGGTCRRRTGQSKKPSGQSPGRGPREDTGSCCLGCQRKGRGGWGAPRASGAQLPRRDSTFASGRAADRGNSGLTQWEPGPTGPRPRQQRGPPPGSPPRSPCLPNDSSADLCPTPPSSPTQTRDAAWRLPLPPAAPAASPLRSRTGQPRSAAPASWGGPRRTEPARQRACSPLPGACPRFQHPPAPALPAPSTRTPVLVSRSWGRPLGSLLQASWGQSSPRSGALEPDRRPARWPQGPIAGDEEGDEPGLLQPAPRRGDTSLTAPSPGSCGGDCVAGGWRLLSARLPSAHQRRGAGRPLASRCGQGCGRATLGLSPPRDLSGGPDTVEEVGHILGRRSGQKERALRLERVHGPGSQERAPQDWLLPLARGPALVAASGQTPRRSWPSLPSQSPG